MCEHNLVIGDHRTLYGGATICTCGFSNPDQNREVIYGGDRMENCHYFIFKTPFNCGGCGNKIWDTNIKCGPSSPINVTQEFLSLPVGVK